MLSKPQCRFFSQVKYAQVWEPCQLWVIIHVIFLTSTVCIIGIERLIPMWFYSMFFASRVGEATVPGPIQSIRIAVTNPTSVYQKTQDICKFQADVVCAAETSATPPVQEYVSQQMRNNNYRSFWSPPVNNLKATTDDRPSYRREALGTAIFSRIPCRDIKTPIPPQLWETMRFSACICRLGNIDVMVASGP